ncbi:MAG: type-F conjugative transfer system pilin assembly protein TrbC [Rhodobacteraceae bacterium]|nr:type-F conjugative transfer system pilin assembly protein TrbC [Paracoccaceae bacterium]
MAYVEEKKLLRTLISTTCLVAHGFMAFAQDSQPEINLGEPLPLVEIAPGAQGFIEPSIARILDDARRLGAAWKENLSIQQADDFGRSYDIDGFRDRALANPRVRALLGADVEGLPQSEGIEPRYGNKQVFLLASFSMPPNILRVMMDEAKTLDIPVIFRGFVNNSVYDTQIALQAAFGNDADLVGFGIDPTIFTRFQIEAVPQLIVTRDQIDVCETTGCEADPIPVHDRVGGNIPLRDALQMIVMGQGDALEVAKAALETIEAGQ